MKSRRDFLISPLKKINSLIASAKSDTNSQSSPNTIDSNKKQPNSIIRKNDIYESCALGSDFSEETRQIEAMRLGIDPAGLSKSDLLELVYNSLTEAAQHNTTTKQI